MKTGDKDLFTIIYTENQQQFLNSKVLFKKDPYLIFFSYLSLKGHVHPNGFARLCFCFEMIRLSNAVF